MNEIKINPISLPCLKGAMGDWYYYVTILSFKEVANRIKLPEEIDKKYSDENLKLGEWIQRKLDSQRTKAIVEYLNNQPQRFFNSIILGIFGGSPSWQNLQINSNKIYEPINEESIEYFSRTFGILTLNGEEDIFAIDGQHRAIGIREAFHKYKKLSNEEIPVIFVSHKTDSEGLERTRRLFSTLNRYAKPVSHAEIIALSEDNNCAIITRQLAETELLKDKVIMNKNNSISIENEKDFTNILTLYDIVKRVLTNETVVSIKVQGKDKDSYTTDRITEKELQSDMQTVLKYINLIIDNVPSVSDFFNNNKIINRKNNSSSLLFRPLGQKIIFDILKISTENGKEKEFLQFLNQDDFNLGNHIWQKIFWDQETGNIVPDKPRQKYATLLILESLGINIKRTKRDTEIFNNYGIKPNEILKVHI